VPPSRDLAVNAKPCNVQPQPSLLAHAPGHGFNLAGNRGLRRLRVSRHASCAGDRSAAMLRPTSTEVAVTVVLERHHRPPVRRRLRRTNPASLFLLSTESRVPSSRLPRNGLRRTLCPLCGREYSSAEEPTNGEQMASSTTNDDAREHGNGTSHQGGDDAGEDPRVERPDPEDPPVGPTEELDDEFDPAAAPSNPDLIG
jgi:hypothetical protein